MISGTQLLDRGAGIARTTSRQLLRVGRRLVGGAYGMTQRVRHAAPAPKPEMDDTTLARKVETEIFRGADAPKGSVDVNVVDGVVELRGQVKRPEQVRELEAKTRAIPEVRDVENLLHLPKTPARRRSGKSRARPRTEPRGLNAEKAAKISEPSPEELAESAEGRRPAPMGAEGDTGQPE
jgi:BON domain